ESREPAVEELDRLRILVDSRDDMRADCGTAQSVVANGHAADRNESNRNSSEGEAAQRDASDHGNPGGHTSHGQQTDRDAANGNQSGREAANRQHSDGDVANRDDSFGGPSSFTMLKVRPASDRNEW